MEIGACRQEKRGQSRGWAENNVTICTTEPKQQKKRGEGLHEPPPTALGVDFLESFFLLSLVDNTDSSHEETQKNGHKPVNGGENGIQSVVGLLCYGCHTERFRLCNKSRIGTECAAHLHKIRSVEVTAALEHILYCNPGTGSLLRENRVEICPEAKSEEPDECAGNGQINHVGDEQPVQENKTTGNVVLLDHGPNRERPGNEEEQTQNKPNSEIHLRQNHVHEDIGLSPHD